jgi:prevent-host-death family protein
MERVMLAIDLAEAKAHLSELVSKAESGEETIIMRRGEAVAKLVPVAMPKKALRTRAQFRASLRKARTPSAVLIRDSRDEGY